MSLQQITSTKRFRALVAALLCVIFLLVGWWMFFYAHRTVRPLVNGVVMKDTSAPTVTLRTPADQQHVSGIISLSVTATDDRGVTRVAYYVDGVFVSVSYARPFGASLDTTKFSDGDHDVLAKAYDTAGNVATSKPRRIVVSNAAAIAAPDAPATPAVVVAKQVSVQPTPGDSASIPSGGTTATPPDTQPPSQPGGMVLGASDGYTADVGWTASSDNVGVTRYTVYRDGAQLGTTAGTSYQDETVVPGNTYHYFVTAADSAGNTSAASSEPSITLVSTTIWLSAESPDNSSFDNSPGAIELGVKFRPLVDGKISGVRFYKAAGSTGTHVGHLWSSSGGSLASASFSGESASGWQEVSFASPVAVTAGTTYVASYFAPNGHYGYASAYFASAGLTSQYLAAMASGVDGNNGVYHDGSAGFPASSFDNTNYWVDVTFVPNKNAGGPAVKLADTSQVFPGYPGSNNTGVLAYKRLPKRDRKITIFNNAATLENIELPTDISIRANNVTLRNVRIAPSTSLIWGITQITGSSGLTVEDTEIYGDGVHSLQYGVQDNGMNFTGRRLNIHTMTQAVLSNTNVVIEDSFFHDQAYFAGDHTGGYMTTGGNNIVLTHNNLRNPLNQTTTLALMCDFGPVTNVTATNNLLAGGGYVVYAPDCVGSGNIKFHNNKFSRAIWPNGGLFGPVTSYDPLQPGNEWINNTWYEDGSIVNP